MKSGLPVDSLGKHQLIFVYVLFGACEDEFASYCSSGQARSVLAKLDTVKPLILAALNFGV
jgi:hypothetical protein